MFKKVLIFFCLITLLSTPVKASDFEANFLKWLMSLGFDGKIHEVSKVYDENGFIDQFSTVLEEYDPEARVNPFITAQLHTGNTKQFIIVKLENKDLKGTKFLIGDWVAKFVINYAIRRISRLLGLQTDIKKVGDELYRVQMNPAKTTAASRYRFEEIEIFYQIVDKILSIQIIVRAPANYLISDFAKSELNALLRTLERGDHPTVLAYSKTSFLSGRESLSDQLTKEFLRQPEETELEESPDQSEF